MKPFGDRQDVYDVLINPGRITPNQNFGLSCFPSFALRGDHSFLSP